MSNSKKNLQQGFGFLPLLFIISLTSFLTVIYFVTPAEQTQPRYHAPRLNQVKAALMGKIFQIDATSQTFLGGLPSPDRLFATEYFTDFVTKQKVSRPNYDGTSETKCYGEKDDTSHTNEGDAICLGKIPWKELGLPYLNNEQDGSGQIAWFAFSANLMDRNCFFPFNSNVLAVKKVEFTCENATQILPYPWLKIRDAQGNIISDQVVFILFIAGEALPTQRRTPLPTLADADQYLDSVTIDSSCHQPCQSGNFHNGDRNNDFIIGNRSKTFNDQLIYITLEEYLSFIEKIVLNTTSKAWLNFYKKYQNYPNLIDPTKNQETNDYFGKFPFYIIDNSNNYFFETEVSWKIQDKLDTQGNQTLKTHLLSEVDLAPSLTKNEFEQYFYWNQAQKARCAWTSKRERAAYCQVILTNPKAGVSERHLTFQLDKTGVLVRITPYPVPTRKLDYSGAAAGILTVEDFVLDPKTNQLTSLGGWEISEGQANITIEKIRLYPEMPKWFLQQKWFELLFVIKAPQNTCTSSFSCLKVNNPEKNRSDYFQSVFLLAGAALPHQVDRANRPFVLEDYFESPTLEFIRSQQAGEIKRATSDFNDTLKGIK